MKYLILLLAFMSNPVLGQFDYGDIERLERDCVLAYTSECISDLTHAQRIHLGLFTIEQLPHLLALQDLQRQILEYKESQNTGERVRWLLFKNEFNHTNYEAALVQLITLPENRACLKKQEGGGLYQTRTRVCIDVQLFVADSYISAAELAEILADNSGTVEDLENLLKIARSAGHYSFGADGAPKIIVSDSQGGYMTVDNPNIRNKYRYSRWQKLERETQQRLGAE